MLKRITTLRLRYKLGAIVAAMLAVLGGAVLTAGVLEHGVADPFNRTIGPHRVFAVAAVRAGGMGHLGLCSCAADREDKISDAYGLTTKVSVYGTQGTEPRPGIVLIHGHTAIGRKLPTYKVLATKLAEKGYVVLTLDLPGFGEADDPFLLEIAEALDETNMVDAALRYFVDTTNVDADRLTIIGHSRGRAAALKVGVTRNEIKNIIVMGVSSTWVTGRDETQGPNPRDRRTYKFVYGRHIPDWVTPEIWNKHVVHGDIGEYIDYFGRPGHKPLMVIVGELERRRAADVFHDREPSELTVNAYNYLEQTYAEFAEPKRYVVLSRSDHYFNTAQSLGINVYDRTMMANLINEITKWLQDSQSPPADVNYLNR